LAVDLRDEVRAQLRAGRTEDEVLAYLTARYGEFIRYRPALSMQTAALWAGPPALVVTALATLAWVVVRRQRQRQRGLEPGDEADPEAAA
jgi:cytochrome c-type biogenesis protein CcmH